jgi:hypothetical protein
LWLVCNEGCAIFFPIFNPSVSNGASAAAHQSLGRWRVR